MKKKVGIVLISDGIGGAESVVKEILENISKKNLEFYLIVNHELFETFKQVLPEENIHDIGNIYRDYKNHYIRIAHEILNRVLDRKKKKIRKQLKTIQEYIEVNQIELLHSHLTYDMYLVSELKLRKPELITLYTIHGSLGLDSNDKTKRWLKTEKIMSNLKRYDYFTSACNYFLNLVEVNGIGIKNSMIINNGISKATIEEFLKEEKKERKDIVDIVYLGGSKYIKGADILAKALRIIIFDFKIENIQVNVLRNVDKNSEFYKLIIEYQLTSYIKFYGYIPSPKHLEIIHMSDIYVLPSRSEGIANTLMEAIGMEKAIVATNVGGTPELIKNDINGMLCEPTPESLAHSLKELILSKQKRSQFSDYNKKIKHEYYWENIVPEYEQLYLNLLE